MMLVKALRVREKAMKRLWCWWYGHRLKTVDHPKYPIYKIHCLDCRYVMWDGGFEVEP